MTVPPTLTQVTELADWLLHGAHGARGSVRGVPDAARRELAAEIADRLRALQAATRTAIDASEVKAEVVGRALEKQVCAAHGPGLAPLATYPEPRTPNAERRAPSPEPRTLRPDPPLPPPTPLRCTTTTTTTTTTTI